MRVMRFAGTSRILAVVVFIAALLTVILPAGTARAEAYQYWGYYTLSNGQWQYAQTGPDQTNPTDGSVEGWRFAVASQDDARPPRGTVTFSAVCGSTKAVDGKKRVAVVIDYGRKADATGATPKKPMASCAQVPAAATGADVLAAVSTV
ncbi:MAG: SCO2322 family protein, partial [Antricoccus sp.]